MIIEEASAFKKQGYQQLTVQLKNTPIPDTEILHNLSLYQTHSAMAHQIYINDLYKKIIDIPGVIMEFGVRWGRNLSLFSTLRDLYEPMNYARKIIGFDTFEGFPSVSDQDGNHEVIQVGSYSVSNNYDEYLKGLLSARETAGLMSKKNNFELVKGDATRTLPEYMKEHQETIISFAYFDMDLYKPTKDCLMSIIDRIPKGGIIAFDELNCSEFPGETVALIETLGLHKRPIFRNRYIPYQSYVVF